MAEFLGQTKPSRMSEGLPPGDGFDAMGKPIPLYRRSAALAHCRAMGLTDDDGAWTCIGAMVKALENDEPYEAMRAGMVYLDLVGTYRIMAVLLTAPDPETQQSKAVEASAKMKPKRKRK